MRLFTLAGLGLLVPLALSQPKAGPPPVEFDPTHALWTEVLQAHVAEGRFDYAGLKKDRSKLDTYLMQLRSLSPEQLAKLKRADRYAFWINVYNAYTISLVVDNYPLESIKDLGGVFKSVWKKRFIPLGRLYPEADEGDLNLDEIEHEILRPRFKDARVHAAVNCASISCPALLDEAFVGERLNAQLDAQVRAWLADPSRNQYDPGENRVRLSKIFDWFEEDFERDGGSVLGWVRKYAPDSRQNWLGSAKIKIKYLDYDWDLNDSKSGGRS